MTISEKIFVLRAAPPFDRLRDSELTLIAEAATSRRYAPGSEICSPERPLRKLHVFVSGGIQSTAGEAIPAVFGAFTLLFNIRTTDTLRADAEEGATCLLLNQGNFFTIINECPSILVGLLEITHFEERNLL